MCALSGLNQRPAHIFTYWATSAYVFLYGESMFLSVLSYSERCCTLDNGYSEYPFLTLTLYHIETH
jgi:hypothetical protein